MGFLSMNMNSSRPRKVGDVLFADSFPESVRLLLTTTTPLGSSEDSSVSGATSDSLGSPPMPSACGVPQSMSVEPKTGGAKRTKPLRYDLLPVRPMAEVALLYGLGARIYAERNWEQGYSWSKSYAALRRHAELFWAGEDWDVDGAHHLAAVVFHALALMEFSRTHPNLDDRSCVST